MTESTKPKDTKEPSGGTPASGCSETDSVTWTGQSELQDVKDEELRGPLVYRVTYAGNRRASRGLAFGWGTLCLTAMLTIAGILALASGDLGQTGEVVEDALLILGLVVTPPILALLGYLLWNRNAVLSKAGIGTPVLRLDEQGFEDIRLQTGHVPWSAVENIGAETAGDEFSNQASHVFVQLNSSAAYSLRGSGGKPAGRIVIWTTPLGIDGYHLARVMEARRRAATA